MKRIRFAMTSLLAVAGAGLSGLVPEASGMGIIMPIYGNTTTQFSAAEAAARRVPLIAIFNPDNGPGTSKRTSYANAMNRIKSAGGQVIGYISTDYGNIDINDVKSQMDQYSSWYGVNGYFIDEMHYTSSKLNYYKSANSYARGKGKFVVGNPGGSISSTYLAAAEILITFENPVSSGWGSASGGERARYGAIPYSASSLGSLVTQADTKGFGWIYATNRSEPDPFGLLPSYWEAEVSAVEAFNTPPLPPPLPDAQFQVTNAAPQPAGGGIAISFPAVARRRYGVQVSTDMQTWTAAVTPSGQAAEITPATDGVVTLQAAMMPSATAAYYRAVDLDALAGK